MTLKAGVFMGRQLPNKKKTALALCTLLTVGLVAVVLRQHLSEWWFFFAMVGIVFVSYVIVRLEERWRKG
jgi:hypothetical protein